MIHGTHAAAEILPAKNVM